MFDYFKKADLKKTHFDMSNHSPYTANLGELLPTYSDAALAGDEWKMRIKETIKTAPFVAPSLVKMSNSNYGFFTPNQCIWHHWNDFVTNGSMVQDTVLSADNKSEVDSVYKWPSIPANLLQIPLKVANGYACPVFSFYVRKSGSSVVRNTTGLTPVSQSQIDLLLEKGYEKIEFDFLDSVVSFPYSPSLLAELMRPKTTNNGAFGFDGSFIGTSLRWICFADEISTEVSLNNPPVLVEWQDVLHFEKVNGKYLNPYFVKHPSYSLNVDWISKGLSHSPSVTNFTPVIAFPVQVKGWHKNQRFSLVITGKDSTSTSQTKVLSASQLELLFTTDSASSEYEHIDLNNLYANDSLLKSWIDGYVNSDKFGSSTALRVEVLANTGDEPMKGVYTSSVSIKDIVSYKVSKELVCKNPYDNTYFFTCPIGAYDGYESENTQIYLMSDLDDSLASSLFGGNFSYGNITHDKVGYSFVEILSRQSDNTAVAKESEACGYSALGFWHYCCQKVSRLVEYFDINIDGLITRSCVPYLAVEYNALPFMAYSKIWNDYFRNSVLQSPEFCYTDVNGCLFNNDTHNTIMNSYLSESIDTYDEKSYYYVPVTQGWVLPVHNKPLEFTDGSMCVIKIDTLEKALSLITGCNISSLFPYADSSSDSVFLPSYYNALCAVKYKNIGKSIYTSGMLEPTNGAKIEEIPDTIIEMRSATALQKFWEKTAVARTIKKWYQGIFGTTPSHDDYDSPLLLGKASSEIQVGEILQQSQTTDTGALGERAGVALGGCNKGVASHYFNEHGVVMILSSITMDISFVDGELPYTRALHSYLDLPYEQFAHIGNEGLPVSAVSAVPPPSSLNSDVAFSSLPYSSPRGASMAYGNRSSILGNAAFHRGSSVVVPNCSLDSWIGSDLPIASDGNINTSEYLSSPFSYTSRYAQWKIKNDSCHGEFRRDMSHWVPTQRLLGGVAFTHFFVTWEFRERNFDLGKFFTYLDGDKFYIDRYNDCSVIRALPFASTPQ